MTAPLVIETTYAAPPERVWEAWTRDEQVARWYCPNPDLETRARLDVRPGGSHEVDMGVFALRGVYSEVEPGEFLAHTWAFDGGHETEVAVRLGAVPGGTSVIVTHDGFQDPEERSGIEQGWLTTLERLRAYLSSP